MVETEWLVEGCTAPRVHACQDQTERRSHFSWAVRALKHVNKRLITELSHLLWSWMTVTKNVFSELYKASCHSEQGFCWGLSKARSYL